MAHKLSRDMGWRHATKTLCEYSLRGKKERDDGTAPSRVLIRPSLQGALDIISRTFAQETAKRVANSSALPSIMVTAPQTIVAPIYYTIDNLIPFDQPVATAATFVGMLLQLILGFFVVMIAFSAREASGYDKTLSVRALIVLRLATCFIAYFILSVRSYIPNGKQKADERPTLVVLRALELGVQDRR